VALIFISICLYILRIEVTILLSIIGFSLGNIVQHTKKEKFIFIDKKEACGEIRFQKDYRIDLIKGIIFVEVMSSSLRDSKGQKLTNRESSEISYDID
jgi:hypothetical protein